jgi:serine phosphatase RsbU (regulator of sigma subunit)
LRQIVVQHRSASASHLADAIFADVLAFQGDAPQYDDVTLLVAALDEAALLDEALLD